MQCHTIVLDTTGYGKHNILKSEVAEEKEMT